ncbi:hypothetical protein OQJ19_00880 [Fluoribacter gormanii]|uniref:Uncharacterized protein n=1 Tax=Fluoribacter gormanii TaxID=464 RepID=A0A377GI34_9GAMM|nr:hypothetical protein [Fluoribacter gormanii]KTD03381.1 hypothetical protein Lgor_1366 [Fluoribacter gormanii]MCW8444032.1 hypothetical protein [Fluoribacter gormanii]MCW8469214.1 hypothetical protein [Fluoribacter gormanii]SIQ51241.1 hypothetical protein SAMN05421777_101199 [Fluoribacter gormanii]STO24408.1 Uncharacterised protein [Fluoribacter gormanii]
MAQDKINIDDAGKTGALVALGNTVLAPLYWVDAKLGLTAAIVATSAFLYGAHEIGKKRRPIGNGVNSLNSFFGGNTGDKSTEVQNALANIVVGGAAIFDEIMPNDKNNRP